MITNNFKLVADTLIVQALTHKNRTQNRELPMSLRQRAHVKFFTIIESLHNLGEAFERTTPDFDLPEWNAYLKERIGRIPPID